MRQLMTFALLAAIAAPVTAQAAPTTTPAQPARPAATPAQSAAETKTTLTSAALAKLLDEAELDYQIESGDRVKILYKFTDGRSQVLFLQPMADLREVPIVEVYSPVMPLGSTVPAAVAKRLLEASGKQKIGYYGIEDVEGSLWVFGYHNLPTEGLTAKALAAVLITVAETSDEMEKEQLGSAKDEY